MNKSLLLLLLLFSVNLFAEAKSDFVVDLKYTTKLGITQMHRLKYAKTRLWVNGRKPTLIEQQAYQPALHYLATDKRPGRSPASCSAGTYRLTRKGGGINYLERGCLDSDRFLSLKDAFGLF